MGTSLLEPVAEASHCLGTLTYLGLESLTDGCEVRYPLIFETEGLRQARYRSRTRSHHTASTQLLFVVAAKGRTRWLLS